MKDDLHANNGGKAGGRTKQCITKEMGRSYESAGTDSYRCQDNDPANSRP